VTIIEWRLAGEVGRGYGVATASRELRSVMDQIARQDTAIGSAGVSHPLSRRQRADDATSSRRRNLPSRTTPFVGREEGPQKR
jgi:hypothetical protein